MTLRADTRRRLAFASAVTCLLAGVASTPATVSAHEVLARVSRTDAVVVVLAYSDGQAYAGESFELLMPGSTQAFFRGTTDPQGHAVFVPDRPPPWRFRSFAADGHGVDFPIDKLPPPAALTAAPSAAPSAAAEPWPRALRILGGVTIIAVLAAASRILLR